MAVAAHHRHADNADLFALGACFVASATVLFVGVVLLTQPAAQTWLDAISAFVAQHVLGHLPHLSRYVNLVPVT